MAVDSRFVHDDDDDDGKSEVDDLLLCMESVKAIFCNTKGKKTFNSSLLLLWLLQLVRLQNRFHRLIWKDGLVGF